MLCLGVQKRLDEVWVKYMKQLRHNVQSKQSFSPTHCNVSFLMKVGIVRLMRCMFMRDLG